MHITIPTGKNIQKLDLPKQKAIVFAVKLPLQDSI